MSLVGWWPLDGTTESRVGPSGSDPSVTYVDGKIGQGIDCDGSQIRVSSNNDGIHSAFTGNQMTLAFWLREYDHDTYRWKDIFGMDGTRFERGRGDDGNPAGDYWCNLGSGDGNNLFNGDIGQPGNEWFHVTIRRKGEDYAIYIDGKRDTSRTTSEPMSHTGDFIINENAAGAEIDDVRLYDHALSEKEIQQLSQAKVLHYKFDRDSSVVGDSSGNGNTGVNNGATFVEDSKIGSGAYEFNNADSNGDYRYIESENPVPIPEKFTMGAWIKGDTSNQNSNNIYPFGWENLTTLGPSGGDSDSRTGIIYYTPNNGYTSENIGGTGMYDGRWNLYTVSVDSVNNNIRIYKNGSLEGTRNTSDFRDVNTERYFYVGSAWSPDSYGGHTGKIDDVRVYATVLSDEEVQELYQQRASIDSGGNFHSHELSEQTDTGLEINVESAGNDSPTSGFSKIIVNGNDVGAKGRGINALELSFDGSVVKTESFDVYGSSTAETDNLVQFIDTAKSGNILVFAEDDHAGRVESDGVQTLQEMGSKYIDNVSNDGRSSWAFICVKGGGTFGEEFAPSGNGPVYVDHIFPDSLELKETGTSVARFNEVGPAPNSLVGWWPLDGDTNEYSGESGNASTTVGSPSITSGLGQSAYLFEESSNGERLEASLNRPTNTEITASAWIYPYPSADSRAPIFRADRFYFQHYSNDRIATYWYGSQDNGYHYSTSGSVNTDEWSHVVTTWDDNGNIDFYVNGDYINTVSGVGGGPRDELDSIRIGQENGGRRFNGKIQDVRIYDRALTQDEVQILYNLTDPRQKQQMIQSESGELYTKKQFNERL